MILWVFSTQLPAQSKLEEIVREGISHHDNGDYDQAIDTYKKALELDYKSTLVNYEIALSYFSKGDYQKAIEHSDVVLKQKGEHMLHAYMTKGSALDILGKTKESIKLFEKAIKETGGHYLLYYNLAVNYYKINNLENAEEHLIHAIDFNPNHSSSHLMLANIHNRLGNTVQTLLAAHFFLLIEPNSQRSPEAYQMLMEKFGGNVTKDSKDPNQINISISAKSDSEFSAVELMISMLEASKATESNKGKSDNEWFVDNTKSFFKILGEMSEGKPQNIWWNVYTPFFYEIAKSPHLEAYCHYISQSGNESSRKWLDEHENKLTKFSNWMQEE